MTSSTNFDLIYMIGPDFRLKKQDRFYPVDAESGWLRKEIYLSKDLADRTCEMLNAQHIRPVYFVYPFSLAPYGNHHDSLSSLEESSD